MSVFDPRVNPLVAETQEKATTAPGYYTDYLSGLSKAGTDALGKTADQLVSPLTAMQQTGYSQIPTAAAAYQPGLTTAQQTAAQAAGVDASDISRFMNPYTQSVVNEMQRLSQENMQRNVMPSVISGSVGRGDLGSRRYAGALGQTMADVQKTLTGQQTGALSSGYKTALEAAIKEAELQNQVSQTQAKQAAMEQELGLSGAKALTAAGSELQAYEQAKLDAPLKTATNVSKLFQGQTIPLATIQKTVRPGLKTELGGNKLADVGSIGAFLASMGANKGAPEAIAKFLSGLGIKIPPEKIPGLAQLNSEQEWIKAISPHHSPEEAEFYGYGDNAYDYNTNYGYGDNAFDYNTDYGYGDNAFDNNTDYDFGYGE